MGCGASTASPGPAAAAAGAKPAAGGKRYNTLRESPANATFKLEFYD